MKLKHLILPAIAALALSTPLTAADKESSHSHAHGAGHAETIKAPNGGRLITSVEPHAEFLLTADRKVQITFLDDDGKAVAPAGQIVTVTTGERSSPTRLSFEKSGNALISDGTVPAGEGFATVVQIKSAPDAKIVTDKFYLDLSKCSECGLSEYACACGH